MKNNIMSIVKSKKFMVISAIIAAAALFIVAVRFLGLQYYMFYLIHDFEDVAEGLLKISVFAVMMLFAVILFRKLDLKDGKPENKTNAETANTENKDLIVPKEKNNKGKIGIIAIALIAVLALIALFIFASRFFGMHYMLYNLDDIIEGIFQLVVVAAVIGFGAVFAKKVLEKL